MLNFLLNLRLFFCLLFVTSVAGAQPYFAVQKDGKWGVQTIQGQQVQPYQYHWVGDFDGPIALFRQGMSYGLLHATKGAVVAADFQRIEAAEGAFIAWKDGKAGLINAQGQQLIPLNYERLSYWGQHIWLVKNGALLGLIKQSGEQLLPVEQQVIEPYQPGQFHYRFGSSGRWGVFTPAKVLLEPKYDQVRLLDREAVGYSRSSVAYLRLNEAGDQEAFEEVPNQVALEQRLRQQEARRRQQLLSQNPKLKEPQWVQLTDGYTLTDGTGFALVPERYFSVGADSLQQFVLALRADPAAPEAPAFADVFAYPDKKVIQLAGQRYSHQ